MDSVRLSQQTTQQTSFLPNQSQYTPADVPVPDFTTDAHSSPISNTGSLVSGSADIAMCPPVGHVAGDGIPGTGVPPALEAFRREQFAVLPNSIASMQTNMQKQISELIAVTTQTTKWMQDQQARSIEIDKTLAELRANDVAPQSAPVFPVETKSVSSDWLLPKIAISAISAL